MQAFHQRSNPDPPESLSVRLNGIPGTFFSPGPALTNRSHIVGKVPWN